MIDLQTMMGGGGYAAPCLDFIAATEPLIDRVMARSDENGGLRAVCELAALKSPFSSNALIRRLYDARTGRSRSVNADIAEALTQALGDYRLEDLDIPTIPRCISAAVEMVEAYVDVKEITEPELDTRRLARTLTRFACGYIHSFDDIYGFIADEAWQVYVELFAEPEAWLLYAEMFGEQEDEVQVAVAELVAA